MGQARGLAILCGRARSPRQGIRGQSRAATPTIRVAVAVPVRESAITIRSAGVILPRSADSLTAQPHSAHNRDALSGCGSRNDMSIMIQPMSIAHS
jgi:hypothetical protein